jgi:hypothetical protein
LGCGEGPIQGKEAMVTVDDVGWHRELREMELHLCLDQRCSLYISTDSDEFGYDLT